MAQRRKRAAPKRRARRAAGGKGAKAAKAESRTWLSPSSYARWRGERGLEGATRQGVRKAIDDGRITSAELRGGRWHVCAELADREWEEATNPAARRGAAAGGAPSRDVTGELFGGEEDTKRSAADLHQRMTHSLAQTRRTLVQAQLAELQLQRQTGQLVNAEDARREAYQVGQEAREKLMDLSDRLAPMVVGRTDLAEVHALIVREVLASLEAVSRWIEDQQGGP